MTASAGAQEAAGASELQTQHQLVGQELEALHIEMLQQQKRQAAQIERIQKIRTQYDALTSHIGELSAPVKPTKPIQPPTPAAPLPEPKPANPTPITSPSEPKAKPTAKTPGKRKTGNGLISVRYVFENAAKAQTALATLRSRGIEAYSAQSEGSYRVYAGAYVNERTAMSKARSFGELEGVEPEIYFPD